MPMPVKVEAGAGALTVDGAFSAVATGVSDPRLDSALNRLAVRLSRQTGIPISGKAADRAHASLRVEATARGTEYPTWRG